MVSKVSPLWRVGLLSATKAYQWPLTMKSRTLCRTPPARDSDGLWNQKGFKPTPLVRDSEGPSNDIGSKDPFAVNNEELNAQCDLIASSKPDSIHFMKGVFNRPLESSISTSVIVRDRMEEESRLALPHPVWTMESVHAVQVTHHKPANFSDRLAYASVKTLRCVFDICSGYSLGRVDERGWLNRIVYLETVAGVPGMVGAMVRHLTSLRRMQRDYGWIHTLLEEAENERMHLMTAMVLKKPSRLFRIGVIVTQGLFLSAFSVSYLISPRFAHRFVGYLEEEAVVTYSKLLHEIDAGHLPLFEHLPAPSAARDYWQLGEGAMLRDVILAIRADESHHREVNHMFAAMEKNDSNPFPAGH